MGSCHVLIHKVLLEKLNSSYSDQVEILRITEYGEDNLFNVLLESSILADGYHGQQELFIEDNRIKFRRDTDT